MSRIGTDPAARIEAVLVHLGGLHGADMLAVAGAIADAITELRSIARSLTAAGGRTCPDCGAAVGRLIGVYGGTERIDAPRFDANLGWIAKPHSCPESIERARTEIEGSQAELAAELPGVLAIAVRASR